MNGEMVFLKRGQFLMGDGYAEYGLKSRTVHLVHLNSYYICRYPVTQKLWNDVLDDNPSNMKNEMSPIEMVSWYDVIHFCIKLSLINGLQLCYKIDGDNVHCNFNCNGYRLPTEAEWEYAARGGELSGNFIYSGSNDINQVAWYKNNSQGKTKNTGTKKPNELGIYDMSGNVWEWCWDWFSPYKNVLQENPVGPVSGETKIYRGGSYLDFDYGCTVFIRGHRRPDLKQTDIGFRLARSYI